MRIHAATASVVGEPSSGVWAQIVSTPKAYAMLEVHGQSGDDAISVGNHIAAQMVDALNDPPISLHEIELLAQDAARQGASSIALLVPVGCIIYLVLIGGGGVYLKRGALLARLLDTEGQMSGEVAVGDVVVLMGRSMRMVLDEDQLSKALDHLHAEALAEKITLLLHQKAASVQGATLCFEVTEFIEEDLPVETSTSGEPVDTSVAGHSPSRPWMGMFTRQRIARIARRIRSGRMPTRDEFRTRFSHLDTGSQKILLGIAIIAGILFLVSVILGIKKVAGYGMNSSQRQTVSDVRHLYDEGVALQSLNPVKSRETLTKAKTTLEPILKAVSKSSADGRSVEALYRQIGETLTTVQRKYGVVPEIFYDVSLLKKNARADSFNITEDTLSIVDTAGSTVYAVNMGTKHGESVASGSVLAGVTSADAGGDNIYALAAGGIYRLSLGGKATTAPIIKKDDTWGTIVRIVTFGGNLYLLDTTKSRIWKYVATDTGFTERREYLNPDTLPDLSKASGLSIDGSVWIGDLNGTIHKFTQGKEESFLPVGVDPTLTSPLVVYTADDSTNLYVLDPTNNRVVALDKEGVYIAQYAWEGAFKPTDVVVSEKQKKILLLSDGVVYSIDLK